MKSTLPFDFTVDKAAKTVVVKREFDAGISLVWDAFTKKEILDQWWAPKPYASQTRSMNFEPGGQRVYAMVSPEGHKRWALQKYSTITPKTGFKMSSAFLDSDEKPELPGSDWNFSFSEQNGITKVTIIIKNESLERMMKMIEMGFKEGFAAALDQLDELIASKKEQR